MSTDISQRELFVIDKEKSNFDIDNSNTELLDTQDHKKSSGLSINEFIKNNKKLKNIREKNNQQVDNDEVETSEYINPLKRRQAELESLVFGDSPELYQNIISQKHNSEIFSDEEPKDKQTKQSVWKDSDDQSKVKLVMLF